MHSPRFSPHSGPHLLFPVPSIHIPPGSKGFPDSSAGEDSACNAGNPSSIPGSGKSPGEGIDYPLQYPWASLVSCNGGDLGLIPGLGRSLGEGNRYPLQCSGLENSMDRGAWRAIVHGVAKSQTRLSYFHFAQALASVPCFSASAAVAVWE